MPYKTLDKMSVIPYNITMFKIIQSRTFREWLSKLRDRRATDRIAVRLHRAAEGNLGDAKPLGSGLYEMRIDYGPGYRLYFVREGRAVIVLLCGGDKGSQQRNIRQARRMAARRKAND